MTTVGWNDGWPPALLVHVTTDRPALLRRLPARLYGRVSPAILAHMAATGWRVHRIGHAVYAHHGDLGFRWVAVVSGPAEPAWAADIDGLHRHVLGRGELPVRWQPRERASAERWLASRGGLAWWQEPDGSPMPGLRRPWRVS